MERFQYAGVSAANGNELIDRCLAELGPVPDEATLGLVYVTDEGAGILHRLLERLAAAAPQVRWVGTLGTGICATGAEYYDRPAAAVLVTDIPADHFRLLPSMPAAYEALPEEIRTWCDSRQFCFGLLHGDPFNPETPNRISTLAAHLPVAFLNGGLTASNTSNYQFAGGGPQTGTLSGVLFDESVAVITDHTQGCSPLGPIHTITEAEQTTLSRLDGRPALDVLKEDVGELLARDLRRIGGYIFAALPIPGTDTGDYLVRNILAVDTGSGRVAIGDYLEGQQRLMFCKRDPETAREDMQRMLARVAGRLQGRRIRGGVYVSCLGRGRHQFGEESQEVRLIHESLGEFPLVGFFANGELYNGRLYGYTGVLTLFVA